MDRRILWISLFVTFCVLFSMQMAINSHAGSIWAETQTKDTDPYSDQRAYRIDDIVTILIVENSSASEETSTSAKKENKMTNGITSFLTGNIAQSLFGSTGGSVNYPSLAYDHSHEFAGEGKVSGQGKVTATIAGVVKDVLPNGNLLIEGKRTIFINDEKKNIIITGIVRPEDISTDNTVRSSYVADAQITYEGFGPLTDKTKPGFLSRLLDWVPIF